MPTLHVLGTGAGLIHPGRCASAYLLETAAGDLLFDCGEPVAATLAGRAYDWRRLCAIVLSHTHADHAGGLPLLVQQLHLSGRSRPLALYGPPEYVERLSDQLALHYLFLELCAFDFTAEPLAAGRPFRALELTIEPVATRHLAPYAERLAAANIRRPCLAFAFRVRHPGASWLYSGDLGSFDDVRDALPGCRFAIIDSTHIDLAGVLCWAGANRETEIILSHIAPGFDRSGLERDLSRLQIGNVRVAEDGMKLSI